MNPMDSRVGQGLVIIFALLLILLGMQQIQVIRQEIEHQTAKILHYQQL